MTRRKRSDSDVNDIVKKTAGKNKSSRFKENKNFIIDQNTNGLYFVRFEGGGQVPVVLSGKYLRYEVAQYAINAYLVGK